MRFLRGPTADKFDLHDYFDVVKLNKNRKGASCSGGEHGFEKQPFDANSHQGASIVFRSATAAILKTSHQAKTTPGALPLYIWG